MPNSLSTTKLIYQLLDKKTKYLFSPLKFALFLYSEYISLLYYFTFENG